MPESVQVQSYLNDEKVLPLMAVKWESTVERRAAVNVPNQVVNRVVDVVCELRYLSPRTKVSQDP